MVSIPSTFAKGELSDRCNGVVSQKYLDLGATLGACVGALDSTLSIGGPSNNLDVAPS